MNETWYSEAFSVAQALHEGQIDRAGRPKIDHVVRVAQRLTQIFPDAPREQIQAALLHDALQECATTPVRLVLAGIEPEIVQIVEQLTRPPETPYLEHIRALVASGDIGAIRVKLAEHLEIEPPEFSGDHSS